MDLRKGDGQIYVRAPNSYEWVDLDHDHVLMAIQLHRLKDVPRWLQEAKEVETFRDLMLAGF